MKFKTLLLTAALGCTLSTGVLAASPNWNYVEGGYTKQDIDGTDDQNGFNVGGSFRFNDNYFVRGRYTDVSDDLSIAPNVAVDIDTTWVELGFGYIRSMNSTTDLYGVIAIEDLEIEIEDTDLSDTGYSAHVGVKSRVADQLELFGEIGYADIDDADIDDLSLRAGANYYFTDQLSIGADYRKLDDVDLLSANIRYSF